MVCILIFFIYELAPFWWSYLAICGIIPCAYMTYYVAFFFVETPQFVLQVEGNTSKAMEILRKIAEYNTASEYKF